MSLTLYYHPLASFCWKVLIALYENEIAFTPHLVDLGDAGSRNSFFKVWPIGKFPVLQVVASGQVIPETSIIIEYLSQHYPNKVQLIPADPDLALQVRLQDRIYDSYVNEPMGKIVTDKLRPAEQRDSYGVAKAKELLLTAYGLIDSTLANQTWATGEHFTLADCAAAPALFYADKVVPFANTHKNVAAYLQRLTLRPSFARVLKEAEPYFAMFPG